MSKGGQGAASQQCLDDAVIPRHPGLLRRDGHGDHVPTPELQQLACQGGVGVGDVGGVLGAAALDGDEGALVVDPGDLALLGEVGEEAGALLEDLAAGRHA